MPAFRNSQRARNNAARNSGRVVHWVEIPVPARRPRVPRVDQGVVREARPQPAPAPAAPPASASASLGRAELARLEEQLLARASARLARSAPSPAPPPASGADRRKVEQLERRLRKLSGALDERDRMLRRLLARSEEDPGVASLTASTGLDETDALFEAKKEMMSSIFQANLQLRRQVRSGG